MKFVELIVINFSQLVNYWRCQTLHDFSLVSISWTYLYINHSYNINPILLIQFIFISNSFPQKLLKILSSFTRVIMVSI